MVERGRKVRVHGAMSIKSRFQMKAEAERRYGLVVDHRHRQAAIIPRGEQDTRLGLPAVIAIGRLSSKHLVMSHSSEQQTGNGAAGSHHFAHGPNKEEQEDARLGVPAVIAISRPDADIVMSHSSEQQTGNTAVASSSQPERRTSSPPRLATSRCWQRQCSVMRGEGGSKAELYRLLGALALGQFASLLITFTGLTSSILAQEGIDAPTSQSFCNYVLLAGFYGSIFLSNKKPLQVRWYFYLLLALLDVEGNYFVVKAYQYTSLTSVMLLDCWTIPCVLLLTRLFIKTKYKIGQLVGVCCCVLGLVLVILSDVHANDRAGGSNAVLGDALVIIGSTLYALTNVSEEFLIKKVDFVELMAFLGLFGALISACQVAILERQELESIVWTRNAVLPFIGYAVSLFLFYSSVPLILKLSGSALLNLSLLTSDMWAVAIRVFAYHQVVDWLFFVAFATVAIGLVIYSASGKSGKTSSSTDTSVEEVVYKRVETTGDEHDAELQESQKGMAPSIIPKVGIAGSSNV